MKETFADQLDRYNDAAEARTAGLSDLSTDEKRFMEGAVGYFLTSFGKIIRELEPIVGRNHSGHMVYQPVNMGVHRVVDEVNGTVRSRHVALVPEIRYGIFADTQGTGSYVEGLLSIGFNLYAQDEAFDTSRLPYAHTQIRGVSGLSVNPRTYEMGQHDNRAGLRQAIEFSETVAAVAEALGIEPVGHLGELE